MAIETSRVHVVKKGDTLWDIAEAYFGDGNQYKRLAAINNLGNPNLIFVGQEIKLEGGTGSTTTKTAVNKVTISQFGLQSNVENTLLAAWTWYRSNETENYEVLWEYRGPDGVWFKEESTTKNLYSTYSIPSHAISVRFKVKPVSKTYKKGSAETTYFTGEWSTVKTHDISSIPAIKPASAPTVTTDDTYYTLTARVDNVNIDGIDQIEFEIVKDDFSVYRTSKARVRTGTASVSIAIAAGHEYKARCRSIVKTTYGVRYTSEWTDYSANVSTIPAVPKEITTCRATSETSVYLAWRAALGATSYDIEYTTKKEYFDASDKVYSQNGVALTHYEKTGLETGQEYFFRVRAVNDKGNSAWSDAVSIIIGKKPVAPTTWSSSTTVVVGESLTLNWVHNAEDGSDQTHAELELYVNGVQTTYSIQNTIDDEEAETPTEFGWYSRKETTSTCRINTSAYLEGTVLQWRVRTAGITNEFSDWSIQRTVDIYASPTLELSITDSDGEAVNDTDRPLESFPLKVYALAGPNTQTPIGYYLTIVAGEQYETVDNVGNAKMVKSGDHVYSRYFDITDSLSVDLLPSDVDLENNVTYEIICTVSMNSGLTAEVSSSFLVSWTDQEYQPDAEIGIDEEKLVAYISPRCETRVLEYVKLEYVNGRYQPTSEKLGGVYGEPREGLFTPDGVQVYYGTSDMGDNVYYIESLTDTLVEDVTLSVYRREFDGTFTKLETGVENNYSTITDPHPALDYARYRIVAISKTTGAVSYNDIPGYPFGETAVVIQWDEDWTSFDTKSTDEMSESPWSGSMLKLPYNIDISDSHQADVALVEYIGRSHPISYYGTQLGETSTWNVSIDKKDKDTLYALRRLARWTGDVYVREPSGSGYWASIAVSFSQKHKELTIPVTLNITRVEGGS